MSHDSIHGVWVREWPPAVSALGFSHLIYFASPRRPECLPYRNKQDFVKPYSFC